MEEKQLQAYLEKQDFIGFQVHEAELEQPEGTDRYFQLLDYVGSHPQWAKKFCSRWGLSFHEDCGQYLWENPKAVEFVKKLGEAFPFLFYLAEKEGETLKLLVMLTCRSDKLEGDNLSLDRDKFNAYLKQQLKGLLFMSERTGLSPENAQSLIQCVYEYFGLSD